MSDGPVTPWRDSDDPREPGDVLGRVRRVKLVRPPTSPLVIDRPRLRRRVDAGLGGAVGVVVAPPGYGKTTLASQWAGRASRPVAWLTLDAGDNDPVTLAAGLVAALRSVVPGAGEETLRLLREDPASGAERIGGQLADDLLALPGPVALVLENFHALTDPDSHALVRALLRFPVPGLHLLVTSRTEPPLPLASLRGRGHLNEVRSRELAFTEEEVGQFLIAAASLMPPAVRRRLWERSEGWPAGLRMGWEALRRSRLSLDAVGGLEAGDQGAVRAFLLDEVLNDLPEELTDTLLATSVAARISPDLAEVLVEELTGRRIDGEAVLERQSTAQAFLEPLGEGSGWHRYHPLFQGTLLERLRQRHGDAAERRLRERASLWLADHGLLEEAITQLLDAGEPDLAASFLERHRQEWLARDRWTDLERWLGRLPAAVVATRPELLLTRAWVLVRRGDDEGSRSALAQAEAELADLTGERAAALRAEAVAVRITMRRMADEVESLAADAAEALAALAPEMRAARASLLLTRSLALQAGGASRLALRELEAQARGDQDVPDVVRLTIEQARFLLHHMAGDMISAKSAVLRLHAIAQGESTPSAHVWAHLLLGQVAYETNDLPEAVRQFDLACQGRHLAEVAAEHDALVGLALAHGAAGRPGVGRALLRDDARMADRAVSAGWRETVRSAEARLAWLAGDRDVAERWLRSVETPPPLRRVSEVEVALLTRALLLTELRGTAGAAEAYRSLRGVAARFASIRNTRYLVRTLALMAGAQDALGGAGATATLERAVTLAAPGGMVRSFADSGERVRSLLDRLADLPDAPPYAQTLRSALGAAVLPMPAAEVSAVAAMLTFREYQVLVCLQQGKRNREIADELFISPTTVKRHAINLYAKLGVSSRAEAVEAAVRAGVLPAAPRAV